MKTKLSIIVSILLLVTAGCRAQSIKEQPLKQFCETCGHLFVKDSGKMVTVLDPLNSSLEKRERKEYYCKTDAPEKNTARISGESREWFNSTKPEPEPSDTWLCVQCNHYFKPGTGKDVTTADEHSAHIANGTVRFCKTCAPKYDRIVTGAYRGKRFVRHVPPVPEQWVVVKEDGSDMNTYILDRSTLYMTNSFTFGTNKNLFIIK